MDKVEWPLRALSKDRRKRKESDGPSLQNAQQHAYSSGDGTGATSNLFLDPLEVLMDESSSAPSSPTGFADAQNVPLKQQPASTGKNIKRRSSFSFEVQSQHSPTHESSETEPMNQFTAGGSSGSDDVALSFGGGLTSTDVGDSSLYFPHRKLRGVILRKKQAVICAMASCIVFLCLLFAITSNSEDKVKTMGKALFVMIGIGVCFFILSKCRKKDEETVLMVHADDELSGMVEKARAEWRAGRFAGNDNTIPHLEPTSSQREWATENINSPPPPTP
uniref:Transmembrane protein n=1 Tax=Mucochytrium quahogii TaxID=96639 RepID=A0A7S2SPN3_9STRA|mmetsp:Transcript_7420/g.11921  ORF Transcript_7420/g.11921 Transcript_7420/m.11921 type:complete len:277 (-) Transcript_7420:473-1303(-)|eukprot:CAMPEP_0203748212 /NCGR_PEP_ID=MMETSP0098-20131031/3151_1 /ASSEMBLY_ACC=CAM_ASM_000208 /TAXON_ID=96639 /ORGANISM=" , Strain NY0313808BC1" /LENGTH=276 /DNA_ID=CAMNT_0050636873 /DNA_START=1161 /DNA_END=1991 /DNA_ORIENTATION=+